MKPRTTQWLNFVLCVIALLESLLTQCTADHCNWRGSGLSREAHSGTVQQVRLRCTEGSVEWMYPTQALRVILEPNLSSARHTTVCIKPFRSFSGANIYVERAGELDLLVNEQAGRRERVYCFRADSPQHAAVFLQASPQQDISRRTVGFQYELLSNHSWTPDFHRVAEIEAVCRPCNNTELLMAICSSDFVVRGFIRAVSHELDQQVSQVEVGGARLYRQKNTAFQQDQGSGRWGGRIRTPLRCQAKQGEGDFLFTGTEHFGEAWLGCAPRYKDFVSVYRAARETRANPCEFPLD
ncbi:meteorin-like protein [Acipenser ruthenus]|uniref:meteorin-like protein n=1 Tax=Acipenser ruthenus TaxID=7906 RepID=UPI00145B97F6|nr:meteorin-like protein [Acipenser ruthenus]XP_034784290.2 meteorin-like protein [Acipenser ruthenus]